MNLHPIDAIDRVRSKLAFLSSLQETDNDAGLFYIYEEMQDQLKYAIDQLEVSHQERKTAEVVGGAA